MFTLLLEDTSKNGIPYTSAIYKVKTFMVIKNSKSGRIIFKPNYRMKLSFITDK